MPPDNPPDSRYKSSPTVIFIDRLMSMLIHCGGILVILAVLGIFVFIFKQALPLFMPPSVKERLTAKMPEGNYRILAVDEWTALPILVSADGHLEIVDLAPEMAKEEKHLEYMVEPSSRTFTPELPENVSVTAVDYSQKLQELTYGTSVGSFAVLSLNYKMEFSEDGTNKVVAEPTLGTFYDLGVAGYPIKAISYGDAGPDKLVAAIQNVDGQMQVHAGTLKQKRSIMGLGKLKFDKSFDLTSKINGVPDRVIVNMGAYRVLVSTMSGQVYVFEKTADGEGEDELALTQVLQPFRDLDEPRLASMDFALGAGSVVMTSFNGQNDVYSFYQRPEGELSPDLGLVMTHETGQQWQVLGKTKSFVPLASGATAFAASQRNKAFVVTDGEKVSIRHTTTQSVRWQKKMNFSVSRVAFSSKYDTMLLLDKEHRLHVYDVHDDHPEAGFKAFFGKIWYEGASAPAYTWQSSGASDDAEPKLSMVPLIYGSLKATFYALLFAVPVSLLAALYTSQFMHLRFKRIVKPTMEVMASLPSVVLGFLGALWLAPRIETKIPMVITFFILTPLLAMVLGLIWAKMPVEKRIWLKPGYEFLVLIPLVLVCVAASVPLGGVLERVVFHVTDPTTGQVVGDFRSWWRAQGYTFEQRNALVVGFMMAFAVIPIIFSITEDSLSNVPRELVSASLALGASRWQTAIRVVLPTASAGIFSALMIGLGRAVGETMIVLMCTGNTAIMDPNIFNGMRTLSANIATELPEAPKDQTLYRALFLGGFMLFILTFAVNTLAEVLRSHLRNKYKTV